MQSVLLCHISVEETCQVLAKTFYFRTLQGVHPEQKAEEKNCLYAISSTACSAAFFFECQIITINLYELCA